VKERIKHSFYSVVEKQKAGNRLDLLAGATLNFRRSAVEPQQKGHDRS